MEDVALRNFRDFLTIYNRMTEACFSRCVDDLNHRSVTADEADCVDRCAQKHININHKVMSIYMEVQPQIVSRRIEEMNTTDDASTTENAQVVVATQEVSTALPQNSDVVTPQTDAVQVS